MHKPGSCPWCGTPVRVTPNRPFDLCPDCQRTYELERSLPVLLTETWVKPDTEWD